MGKLEISVLFGIVSVLFSSAVQAKLISSCEDALPASYELCAKWVSKSYCDSPIYGKNAQMFCRKSCGLCKEENNVPPEIRGKYVGCYDRDRKSELDSVSSSELPKSDMSVGLCARYCHMTKSGKFAALMLGKYCYCGDSYGVHHRDAGIFCTYQCPLTNQQCGGSWPSVSVYEIAASEEHSKGALLDTDEIEQFILGHDL